MSKWCPKCQRSKEAGDTCDFCGQALEDTLKKDILLNKILQEISDEHKVHNDIYQKQKTRATRYVEYIADHYRESGYTVTEYGKENDSDHNGIDLIVKKENEVIFIKCKSWIKKSLDSVDNKEIKILRIDTYDFLEKNPVFKTYKIKMRYTLCRNFIDTSVVAYINKCEKDDISFEIIESNYNKEHEVQTNYTKTSTSKDKNKKNRNLEKIILIILIIAAILFFLKPSNKPNPTEPSDTNKTTPLTTKAKQEAQKEVQARQQILKEQEEHDRIKNLLSTQKAEREKYQKEETERMAQENEVEMQMVIRKKTEEIQNIDIKEKELPPIVSKEDARAKAKRKLLDAMKSDHDQISITTDNEDPRSEAKRKLLEQMQLSH